MELDELLDTIESTLEDGDVDAAFKLVRRALTEFPDDPDVHLKHGDVLTDSDELEAARDAYERATKLAPECTAPWIALAWADFALLDFDSARRSVQRANTIESSPDAWYLLGLLEERAGRIREADSCFQRAHNADAEDFPLPLRIPESEFRDVVAAALDRLPDAFRAALDGEVAVLVQPVPELDVLRSNDPPFDPQILGLYAGTPLPQREASQGARLPDVVYLFQHNLEHSAVNREELLEEIAVTVYHEVGHYLGYDDDELDEKGFG